MARILIADDDPMVRRTIAKGLATLRHDLLFVSDGIHAIDLLRCNAGFDLLITDISMPLLDGRQLVGTLAHDPSLGGIPVLIMSGVVGVRDIADLLEMGATKFLAKPLNMAVLREDVNHCLELRSVGVR
ncbi:MAG: response regulator [bacterium]|nr:response regulator [bacterium]